MFVFFFCPVLSCVLFSFTVLSCFLPPCAAPIFFCLFLWKWFCSPTINQTSLSQSRGWFPFIVKHFWPVRKLFWLDQNIFHWRVKTGLNPKKAGGALTTPDPCGFSKSVSSKERVKPWFFVTFNIIISNIFPENFIEIPQVVHKIWSFSLPIFAIFIDFLTFPCYKETDDVNL